MNDHMEQLWNKALDGEITPAERELFERHLRDNPADRRLWEAESRWLASLRDDTGEVPAAVAAFTQAVFQRAAHLQPARSILAKIGRWAAAAAVVVVTWQALYQMAPVRPIVVEIPAAPDSPPGAGAIPGGASDPLSVLVMDFSRQVVEDQPATVRSAISRTTRIFDWDLWLEMVGPAAKSEPRTRS